MHLVCVPQSNLQVASEAVTQRGANTHTFIRTVNQSATSVDEI